MVFAATWRTWCRRSFGPGRLRGRASGSPVLFIAEAYDNDPAKVPGGDPLLAALDDRRGNVMFDLLARRLRRGL